MKPNFRSQVGVGGQGSNFLANFSASDQNGPRTRPIITNFSKTLDPIYEAQNSVK